MTGLWKCRGSAVEGVVGMVFTTQVSGPSLRYFSALRVVRPLGQESQSERASVSRIWPSAVMFGRPAAVVISHTVLMAFMIFLQGIDATNRVFERLVLPHLALPITLGRALAASAPSAVPA